MVTTVLSAKWPELENMNQMLRRLGSGMKGTVDPVLPPLSSAHPVPLSCAQLAVATEVKVIELLRPPVAVTTVEAGLPATRTVPAGGVGPVVAVSRNCTESEVPEETVPVTPSFCVVAPEAVCTMLIDTGPAVAEAAILAIIVVGEEVTL
jgi:hypothetical protein